MNKWILFLTAAVAISVRAEAPAEPPSPPFLNLPARMSYEVVLARKSTSQAAGVPDGQVRPVRGRVTVWDGRRSETVSWSDGSTSEVFLLDGLLYGHDSTTKSVRVEAPFAGVLPQTASSGIAGFNWLSAANFKGEGMNAGAPCFLFQDTLALVPHPKGLGVLYFPNDMPDGFRPATNVEAVVDKETRLPKLVRIEDNEYTFTFLETPTDAFILPPDIQSAFDLNRKRAEKLTSSAPAR